MLNPITLNPIKLEEICSCILDGVVVASADKVFIFWNKAARDMLGDVPDDTPPEMWAQRYHLFDLQGKALDFEALPMIRALNGESYQDYRIMTKSALFPEGIILSVNGMPIRNGAATIGGLTTFRNITATVALEKKLEVDRTFFKNILELIPAIVFIKDLDGKFIYGNKAFHELLKVNKVTGSKTSDYLSDAMAKDIRQHDSEVLRTGEAITFEETIFWDHQRSVFLTTRFPYMNQNNVVSGICAVAIDMTKEEDEKLAREEERRRMSHISKLATIGTLSAEIAHELRNPLAILRTSSYIMKGSLNALGIDDKVLSHQLNVINQTIDRMDLIAKSLTNLSRDSKADGRERLFLDDILREVISICEMQLKKISAELTIQGELHHEIYANRTQISEVLLNLVANAIDAIEDAPDKWVKIQCFLEDKFLKLRIHDSGPGVKSELRSRIFDAFFTTKSASRGTGLGLSISRKILEQHGGELRYVDDLDSHYFEIRLPAIMAR